MDIQGSTFSYAGILRVGKNEFEIISPQISLIGTPCGRVNHTDTYPHTSHSLSVDIWVQSRYKKVKNIQKSLPPYGNSTAKQTADCFHH